ncbi:MAG: hydroxyacid dehydrogenase [bacterium]
MRVLISDKIADNGIKLLQEQGLEVVVNTELNEEQLAQEVANYDALIIRSKTKVTPKVLENPGKLKVIGRAGTGVDNIDLPTATAKGIFVLNTPTANSTTVAEFAIALTMSLLRQIPRADATMKAGQWLKKEFKGAELSGKTIGIIGFGNIGKRVALRLKAFETTILAYDPFLTPEEATKNQATAATLEEIYKQADIITIHVPLLPATKNMISDAQFDQFKKGALLINASRGGIVDEQAMIRALQSGKLAGAALDVFEKEPLPTDSPLLTMENVILAPHIGASTKEAQDRAGVEVAEVIAEAVLKSTYKNLVNKELAK